MIRHLITLIIISLVFNFSIFSQEFSNKSIKLGIGIGASHGDKETGTGGIFSIGFQKSYLNNQLRLSTNLVSGEFVPFAITDTRDQYFNSTSIGVYGFINVIKYKAVSLIAGTGGAVTYTRGLLGTGGWPIAGNNHSEYFHDVNLGVYLGGGLRVDPPKSRLAFEIIPFNLVFGTNSYELGYLSLGIDIKLN